MNLENLKNNTQHFFYRKQKGKKVWEILCKNVKHLLIQHLNIYHLKFIKKKQNRRMCYFYNVFYFRNMMKAPYRKKKKACLIRDYIYESPITFFFLYFWVWKRKLFYSFVCLLLAKKKIYIWKFYPIKKNNNKYI